MNESLSAPTRRPFLSARWENLALLNYAVPDELLLPRLPRGCELDRLEGKAFVSLVAFQFIETRALGVKWPGFIAFPEVNLRFYVKHHGKRAVCFIREFVPSRFVAWVARAIYNEPYLPARMSSEVTRNKDNLDVNYTLSRDGKHLTLDVKAEAAPCLLGPETREHFFKEHDLGVGKSRDGETLIYEVWHPVWRTYPTKVHLLECDWLGLYGPEFEFLGRQRPESVVLAEGSEIRVYPKGKG